MSQINHVSRTMHTVLYFDSALSDALTTKGRASRDTVNCQKLYSKTDCRQLESDTVCWLYITICSSLCQCRLSFSLASIAAGSRHAENFRNLLSRYIFLNKLCGQLLSRRNHALQNLYFSAYPADHRKFPPVVLRNPTSNFGLQLHEILYSTGT